MKRIAIPAVLLLIFIEYGCLKSPNYEDLSDNFVVATNTDSAAVFSTYNTYYISDSVTVPIQNKSQIIKIKKTITLILKQSIKNKQ